MGEKNYLDLSSWSSGFFPLPCDKGSVHTLRRCDDETFRLDVASYIAITRGYRNLWHHYAYKTDDVKIRDTKENRGNVIERRWKHVSAHAYQMAESRAPLFMFTFFSLFDSVQRTASIRARNFSFGSDLWGKCARVNRIWNPRFSLFFSTLKFLFDAVRLCFSSFVLLLLALAAAQSLAYIKLEIRRETHPSRQGKRKRKKKERTTISLLVFHKTQSSFSFWTFSLSLFLSFDCVMFEPSWTPK